MNKEFMDWLISSGMRPFFFREKHGLEYAVTRTEINDNFDYLFCQQRCDGETLSRDRSLEYIGIYCRKDRQFYDAAGCLYEIVGNEDILRAATANALKKNLQQSICEKVVSASPVSLCFYEPEDWTENALLSYILNPDEYVEKEAQALIREYEAISNSADDTGRVIKNIMSDIPNIWLKVVTVTVAKNDIIFTFNMEAEELRSDFEQHYWIWNIIGPVCENFDEFFGDEYYYPQEILRITCNKKVLYTAER